MSLRTDQRGQAIQVGAVLLFAVLIVAFSSYQAVIIPEDNRRVEFNHNQEVQEHLTELRGAVLGAADSRSVRSVTVALGTTYPSRTLGLNPGPPGGSLRTVGTANPMVNLTIENATVDGETGDFWNGTERAYNTGAIAYDPVYNRYDEAPTTVYEHSVLYNRFPSSNTLVLANQTLLDGDRLAITTVNGSFDRASSRSTSVDVRPISSGGEGVLLEEQDTASPITLEFTSQLSASRWERILSDQDNVVDVRGSPSPVDSELNRIRVELATGVDYRLGMTKAAVGQGATGEGPAYLTDIAGDGASIQRGSSHDLTLAVRDRYNNPVAGVAVNGSVEGSNAGSLDVNRKTTGTDGRVTFTYRTTSATAEGDHTINFTTEAASRLPGTTFDAGTPENVSMQVTVTQSGGGGGGTYDVAWTDPSSEDSNSGDSFGSCDADACTWDVGASSDSELDLNATLMPIFEGVDLEFAVSNSTVGTVSPTSATTDSNGAAITTLTANENGTVDVLASANDGSDTIRIDVQNVSADPSVAMRVEDLSHLNEDLTRYNASFELSNLGGEYDHTAVRFYNRDTGTTTWANTTETRDTRSLTTGGTTTNGYDIEVLAINANGGVIVSETISDSAADGRNASGNTDLGDTTSPTITNYDITDQSSRANGVQYEVSFDAKSNEFDRVQIHLVSLESNDGGRNVTTVRTTSSTETLSTYGWNNGNPREFKIQLQLYDSDNVIVDTVTITDPADGNDP